MTARIAPLEPPYDAETAEALARWMPPGSPIPPLALFRTLARHPMLRDRMRPLGAGLLGRGVLPARTRELVILRTSARCDARYEWGVHVAAYAAAAGLDRETVRATTLARPELAGDDALALAVADELHDTATLSDHTFADAVERFGEAGVLELAALAGFYHVIAYVIAAARVEPEPWAAPFPES
ncbi:MAG TPA: carboxymuconolactone decarboxylase family protein [Kofleriaceae bacterium]|nr:carboxymuconolactone decarboxylase family protein [Kofleriaceae bacterium]